MKNTLLLLLFVSLNSCGPLKLFYSQEITNPPAEQALEVTSKAIFVVADIDGRQKKFLLDTGAGISALMDSTAINVAEKEMYTVGSVSGADKKKVDLVIFTANMQSAVFSSHNKVMAYLPAKKSRCAQNVSISGLVGNDVFFKNKTALLLDYTNSKIANISRLQVQNLRQSGFEELKCKFDKGVCYVILEMLGSEYYFMLDTGISQQLAIPAAYKIDLSPYEFVAFEGALARTVGGFLDGMNYYYSNVPTKMGKEIVVCAPSFGQAFKRPLLGNAYMRGFDWIIDKNNGKLYAKRNAAKITSEIAKPSFQYLADESDGKIKITTKYPEFTKYQINDQIVEVDHVKVTPENLCELLVKVNNTKDWSTLDLVVISE